ncbi:MAG TPA: transcriptional regulator [Pseudolabrys sp.]
MRKSKNLSRPEIGPHPHAFLAAWREAAQLTQAKVATKFDVSDVTIHRWETGKAPVKASDWLILAELFGAESPGYLFFPPASLRDARALQSALFLIQAMTETDLERWLGIGESLAIKGAPEPASDPP